MEFAFRPVDFARFEQRQHSLAGAIRRDDVELRSRQLQRRPQEARIGADRAQGENPV